MLLGLPAEGLTVLVERSSERVSEIAAGWRDGGLVTGLVPTMGALHKGHVALLEAARRRCDRVVASVFVNPSQFGPGEDFERYPRDLDADSLVLEEAGADLLFAPEAADIYPQGFRTRVEVPSISEGLCGRFRPGHFTGVATVCAVLFGMIRPALAFFGRKDIQQLAVIRRMARDLRMAGEIVAVPTVREPDGLAMSSRNAYLSPGERKDASLIFAGLTEASELARSGAVGASALKDAFAAVVGRGASLRIQYVELADPEDMEPMQVLDRDGVLAVAVHAGPTRLIDNVLLRPGAGAVEE